MTVIGQLDVDLAKDNVPHRRQAAAFQSSPCSFTLM
jgi:hypothetical protein